MNIAFVPIRSGSKSIPDKNIKPLCGQPLIYWCLKALEESEAIHQVVVALDSAKYQQVIEGFGFKKVSCYWRDAQNAADTSSTESVMLEYLTKHALTEDDFFILVQATSPFTRAKDFDAAINQLKQENADSLLSCVQTKRFFWNKTGTPVNYDFQHRPRRQDFAGMLMENGAFYINKVCNILRDKNRLSGKISVYEMPEYTATEIDEEADWIVAENLMRRYAQDRAPAQRIKLFLTDVDGTLTDAGMYYDQSGNELKKFNTHDGKGLELLRKAGIKVGILTSENTEIVTRRAKKLKVDYLYQGVEHAGKLQMATKICQQEGISLNQVAYIGDDINCKELLLAAGLSAIPANATAAMQDIPNAIRLTKKGGDGAVREFVDLILASM